MADLQIKGDFFKKLQRIKKSSFKKQITQRAGIIAVHFSKERFIKKNWIDKSSVSWKPRKRNNRGSLLVQSGRLKRSIRKLYSGTYFVMIGTDVPYAKIHNQGGTINQKVVVRAHTRRSRKRAKIPVKAHNRRMHLTLPQRKFIGPSYYLSCKIERYLQLITIKTIKK